MAEIDFKSAEYVESQRRALHEYVKGFPFFQLMGFELVSIEPGVAKMSAAWREDLTQPAGIMHGGVIASLVDTAIAHSILLTPEHLEAKQHGGLIVSVDLRIKYLRPVSIGQVLCEARVTRMGRTIIHADATVTDSQGKEVALGDSIYMAIHREQMQKRG